MPNPIQPVVTGPKRIALVRLALCWGLAVPALAQGVPSPPSTAAPAVAAPAAPAAPGLGGKCASCISSLGKMFSGCKHSCCNSPLGDLINGAFQPLKFATGGVIPTPCPGPNDPAHKPGAPGGASCASGGPPSPQQAAEAIKQDQAHAKARVQAVRYLATVPCHYYPEAEVALVTALRTDRNECVRWEAAHALASGCCCTKTTVAALKIAAEGSHPDGNPSETSMRVRVEAINALQHCLALCGESLGIPERPEEPAGELEPIPTPPTPQRPEAPHGQVDGSPDTTQNPSGVRLASYYEDVSKRSSQQLLAEARHLVETAQGAEMSQNQPRGGKSLFELWQRANQPVLAEGGPARSDVSSGTPTPATSRDTVEPIIQQAEPHQLPNLSVLRTSPAPPAPKRFEIDQASYEFNFVPQPNTYSTPPLGRIPAAQVTPRGVPPLPAWQDTSGREAGGQLRRHEVSSYRSDVTREYHVAPWPPGFADLNDDWTLDHVAGPAGWLMLDVPHQPFFELSNGWDLGSQSAATTSPDPGPPRWIPHAQPQPQQVSAW